MRRDTRRQSAVCFAWFHLVGCGSYPHRNGANLFLELKSFLNGSEVARLMALSKELKFVAGRASNPANITKDNLQADRGDRHFMESVKIVSDAFDRSEPFRDFAFPKRLAPPLLCKYEPGMKYGAHADSARVVVGDTTAQSDLSATVFIAHPASYEGGELVIHLGTRPVAIKGEPGEVVIYPSTMLHEVRPVTRGMRVVSITFIESMIPDEHKRTQLYELNEVAALEGGNMRWENRVRMQTVVQNLTRMWSK